jgi:hypothetical protein
MTDLNLAGESYAHSLIAAGKVDRSSAWSFDVADGNALLGKNGDDWENGSRHHLGLDRSANDKTKALQVSQGQSTLSLGPDRGQAARRAAGDSAIEKVVGELIDLIDKAKSAAGRPERRRSCSTTNSSTRLQRPVLSKATDRSSTTRTMAVT